MHPPWSRSPQPTGRAGTRSRLPASANRPSLFRSGGLVLEDFEQELAGDVRGKRVLQLACSCGDEVLSWANLGATAIGIDISEVAISRAREKATAAGISADFRQANMFDVAGRRDDLDLIYLSWGAICWAPDSNRLADIVASRLRPGGSVLLADHHPIWEVLAVRGQNQLAVAGDYFGRSTSRRDADNNKLPVGARDTASPPPFEAFVWPTSDVVMSLLGAGLRLTAFTEPPATASYPELGSAATRLPAYYVIKATKR